MMSKSVECGYLGCMAGLRQRTLLDGNDLFMEFKGAFNPEISVRTSMADYKKEDWLLNFPLYAVEEFCNAADKGTVDQRGSARLFSGHNNV